MNLQRLGLSALLIASAAACSPRLIPGTEVPDNADNRAIFGVIQQYKAAVEKRDAAAVLEVVSERYFDDAGSPDPADDLDYAGLAKALPSDLARVSGVRMEFAVGQIIVEGDKAAAIVRYDTRYRVRTKAGDVAKAQNDMSRIILARENGIWKVRSGL